MNKTALFLFLALAVPAQSAGTKSVGHLVVVGGGSIPDDVLAPVN